MMSSYCAAILSNKQFTPPFRFPLVISFLRLLQAANVSSLLLTSSLPSLSFFCITPFSLPLLFSLEVRSSSRPREDHSPTLPAFLFLHQFS